MSNDEINPEEAKKKKLEALEKMFGPKETKKSPPEESTKDKISLADALKSQPETVKTPEPAKEAPREVSEVKPLPEEEPEKKEIKTGSAKSFPLEKIKENLNPEMKETLKKISSTVPKESVNKLINTMETNKDIVFDKGVTNVFADLDPVEASILSKKMAEWDVPPEASDVNASVIIAWMNKTKK
jgi:hypothetical protein